MYTKLEISNFRAFSSITVAPLNRINLIAGDNNTGKTGLLEAIYLAHADLDGLRNLPNLFRRQQVNVSSDSRDQTDNFWFWLFHKRQLENAWKISLEGESAEARKATGRLVVGEGNDERPFGKDSDESKPILRIATGSNGFSSEAWYQLQHGLSSYRGGPAPSDIKITSLSTRLAAPSDDAELVNSIAVDNEDDELVGYLRLVEPRLRKLKYLKLRDHKFPCVYADIGFGPGKTLIPASQLGRGFARLLSLFATSMVERTQILLIDEFENGLQHDALVPIWKALGQLARNRDIQIFATTHSYECIQAAHNAASEGLDYDLSVIRLQPSRAGEVEAMVLDREAIETALDAHLEVR